MKPCVWSFSRLLRQEQTPQQLLLADLCRVVNESFGRSNILATNRAASSPVLPITGRLLSEAFAILGFEKHEGALRGLKLDMKISTGRFWFPLFLILVSFPLLHTRPFAESLGFVEKLPKRRSLSQEQLAESAVDFLSRPRKLPAAFCWRIDLQ